MAVKNYSYTNEKQVDLLKACAQTIIDKAEEIISKDEWSQRWKITIELSRREAPEIKMERNFSGAPIIETLTGEPVSFF